MEEITFTYPARIMEVGSLVNVMISVEGRDFVVRFPSDTFDFSIYEDMLLMVEGIKKGDGKRGLRFRKINKLSLDTKHIDLLEKIVQSFKKV